jgi:hypothetical protein
MDHMGVVGVDGDHNMKMDHKEIVTEELNWRHLARDRIQLLVVMTTMTNLQGPEYFNLQFIGCNRRTAECFLLVLLLLLFTVTANYVPVKPATTHRRVQQLQSLKADTLTLLGFPGKTVQRYQIHNLKVVDA